MPFIHTCDWCGETRDVLVPIIDHVREEHGRDEGGWTTRFVPQVVAQIARRRGQTAASFVFYGECGERYCSRHLPLYDADHEVILEPTVASS